jgi:DNA-directed RNA polymerase subunit RPC12/RpoP
MPTYTCRICGQQYYSAARLEYLKDPDCCGFRVMGEDRSGIIVIQAVRQKMAARLVIEEYRKAREAYGNGNVGGPCDSGT